MKVAKLAVSIFFLVIDVHILTCISLNRHWDCGRKSVSTKCRQSTTRWPTYVVNWIKRPLDNSECFECLLVSLVIMATRVATERGCLEYKEIEAKIVMNIQFEHMLESRVDTFGSSLRDSDARNLSSQTNLPKGDVDVSGL